MNDCYFVVVQVAQVTLQVQWLSGVSVVIAACGWGGVWCLDINDCMFQA
jgi:hypothetical protein